MALPKKPLRTSRRQQQVLPEYIPNDDDSWEDNTDWNDDESYIPIEPNFEKSSSRSQPEIVVDRDIETLTSDKTLAGISDDIDIIGKLTAHDLMTNSWRRWEHLEPKIYDLTKLIQSRLSEDNMAEQIKDARTLGGKVYEKTVRIIESMILKELSKGAYGKEHRFNVSTEDKPIFMARVINEIMGLGPLEPLYADPSITEIMANGHDDIQVEIRGNLHRVPGARFRDDAHLFDMCTTMLTSVNRRIDIKEPLADGRLADKSRINVVHPIVGDGKTFLTLRKHPVTSWTIKDMVQAGAMTEDIAQELAFLIYNGCSTIIIGGTGTGKQLDDRTLLPTPTGWTTMGEVKVGDYVMSPSGKPTKVTGKFQDKPEVEAYLVKLSDGSTIVADADHNWFTYNRDEQLDERILPKVRTTKEILKTLHTDSGHANHAIKVTKPIQYSIDNTEQRLIDPYLLGTWLGNGYNSKSLISTADEEILQTFSREHEIEHMSEHDYNINNGMHIALEKMSLLNNKHIPETYMIAPEEVRRELLAGILDSGGEITNSGSIEFCSSSEELVDQMRVLVQSLGYITDKGETEQGYILAFKSEVPVFKLTQKQELHEKAMKENCSVQDTFRYIVDIEPYDEEVSMHCITVDSDDHLYLAGDSFITTHNTSMLNALSGAFPESIRTITVEDNLELKLNPDRTVISLEAREASTSGEGAVTIRKLVRNTLRMRPDRIVVGEVRDGTAYDMLQAMNTGHEGSMTTIHANDSASGIDRIANLAVESGLIDPHGVTSLITGAVDLLVVVKRYSEDGSRRISGIYEIPNRPQYDSESQTSSIQPIPLWEWRHTHTHEDGSIEGHYEHINEVSEGLRKKKRLDAARRMSLEEVYELSDHHA